MRASQVAEQRPIRHTRHFLRYKRGGQNAGGQAAHAHLLEIILFQESCFGVLAGSLLSRLELDGHGVVLPAVSVASSEYEDTVGFFWSAA